MAAIDDSSIYSDLLRFKPEGLTPNAWAVKAGVSRTVWADMRRHGNPSRRTLEKLLAAANSSLAEFEALRLGPEPRQAFAPASGGVGDPRMRWAATPPAPLPLIGSGLGGEWGEPGSGIELTEILPDKLLERLPRPASLASDADAFALTIVGESMWPRFRPGARVAVSPRSPVAIGDDVLVRLAAQPAGAVGPRIALIKQLVKRGASTVELRQFNPDLTFSVETRSIEAILKVPGELI